MMMYKCCIRLGLCSNTLKRTARLQLEFLHSFAVGVRLPCWLELFCTYMLLSFIAGPPAEPTPFSLEHAGRDSHRGGAGRHVTKDHGVRSDPGVVADGDAAEDFGPGAHVHVGAKGRHPGSMSLPSRASPAETEGSWAR